MWLPHKIVDNVKRPDEAHAALGRDESLFQPISIQKPRINQNFSQVIGQKIAKYRQNAKYFFHAFFVFLKRQKNAKKKERQNSK